VATVYGALPAEDTSAQFKCLQTLY
jgi:hypothetical protein